MVVDFPQESPSDLRDLTVVFRDELGSALDNVRIASFKAYHDERKIAEGDDDDVTIDRNGSHLFLPARVDEIEKELQRAQSRITAAEAEADAAERRARAATARASEAEKALARVENAVRTQLFRPGEDEVGAAA